MAILESKQQRAALIILVLGVALVLALWPFLTGLIGAPVLYVMFAPIYRVLARRIAPPLAAGLVVVLGIVLILGPGISFITLLATEAQQMAGGVLQSPILGRLSELEIGRYNVGERVEELGSTVASWIAGSAVGVVGAATRVAIQLTIAFFGLYYLLGNSDRAWGGLRPFIPFSRENSEKLRKRFKDVTVSTLIGTFATAVMQGVLVGIGFWATGLANELFWGAVTVILAILPLVGSGLVWGPGAVALALNGQWFSAIGLTAWGILVVGNVDNLVRPYVFRRYAQIHPFITIIGAFAGIRYFGLLGLVIGPLAISYFFELIRMYREEYIEEDTNGEPALAPPPKPQMVPLEGRAVGRAEGR